NPSLRSPPTLSPTSHPLLLLARARAHRALHSFPTRRSSDLRPHETQSQGCERWLTERHSRHSIFFVFFAFCLTGIRSYWSTRSSDRKSTRLNSSHVKISYAVFCLKKKKKKQYASIILYTHSL